MNEEAIFAEAAEKTSQEERAAYLDRACAADDKLRARLKVLLKAHDHPDPFLSRPRGEPAATLSGPIVREGPGSVIGPYKLLEQIGEGGMGLVFMADQLRPVRRRVALKVLKPGMDTTHVIAHFEAERQALAMMHHPNIAQVYDAGMTDSGRPYFAMELVRGVPITEYCDEHRLDTRQRLELFATVCHAVQHAHQKGIIHRDLKPTNVLVTKNDTVAIPKVIDFGIAKATGQELTERTLFTQFAQMIGTPMYMSPEQAEMNSLDVDTRSDVYSLGVLLYELLTGHTPFASETLRQAGLDEMRRIIREDEPALPSHRISTLAADAYSTISERRAADGRQLSRTLRGELDWIVMKALEKDRDRRYESASALAADIERYLADAPVDACPPSAIYRLRKFVRRNRAVLAMASVVMLSLAAATAVSLSQAFRAREAQRQAEVDRDRARQEQRRAEAAETRAATEAAVANAVSNFLQNDLLGEAARTPRSGELIAESSYMTVKEAVDRAAAVIDRRFEDQPVVEAAIRTTIGTAYNNLNEFRLALPHLERAVALRQFHLGPDHPDTLACITRLADSSNWVGRHQDEIALRQIILQDRRKRHGDDHVDTLSGIFGLARAHQEAGELETARSLLEPAVEKIRTMLGPSDPATVNAMVSLGILYFNSDRFEDAMTMYVDALERRKSDLGQDHPLTIWTMIPVARVYQETGRLHESERLLREAIQRFRSIQHSPPTQVSMANALGWLARSLLWQNRFDEAEPIIHEAVTIFDKYSPSDWRYSYWTSLWGAALMGQQRYSDAEPLLLRGYEGCVDREHIMPQWGRRHVDETGARVLRFYELTDQPEKLEMWRKKLARSDPE